MKTPPYFDDEIRVAMRERLEREVFGRKRISIDPNSPGVVMRFFGLFYKDGLPSDVRDKINRGTRMHRTGD